MGAVGGGGFEGPSEGCQLPQLSSEVYWWSHDGLVVDLFHQEVQEREYTVVGGEGRLTDAGYGVVGCGVGDIGLD